MVENKQEKDRDKVYEEIMQNERDWDKLNEEIAQEFPRAPFSKSCINNIHELDDEFGSENVVIIKDDRAKYWHIGDRQKFADIRDTSKYINYTVVRKEDDEPITMRQVIQAMIDDKHYWNEVVQRDSHQFLEGFDKAGRSDIEYVASFGS